jgi:hypothetical protein
VTGEPVEAASRITAPLAGAASVCDSPARLTAIVIRVARMAIRIATSLILPASEEAIVAIA